MKRLDYMLDHAKEKIRRFPMRTKMFLGYVVPIILVNAVVFGAGSYFLESVYARQLRINLWQSMEQAENYVQSDMMTMKYLSTQVRINETVQEVLGEIDGDGVFTAGEMYGNYLRLSKTLQLIEFSNNQCYVGIYLPDDIFFTNDKRRFFAMSSLANDPNYATFQERLAAGREVYTVLRDKQTGASQNEEDYFALLSPVTVNGKSYIVKAEMKLSIIRSILQKSMMFTDSYAYLMNEQGFCYASTDESANEHVMQIQELLAAGDRDRIRLEGREYYVFQRSFGSQNMHLVELVPMGGYLQKSLYVVIIVLLMILASSGTVALISYWMSRFYSGKISALNSRMDAIQHGQINARVGQVDGNSNDEMDALSKNFDFMIDKIQSLMKEQYKLGKDISRSELRALQAQINPHFLYNTLDLINWSAMDYGADSIARLARDLGLFYRLSLNHGHSAILIHDELRHVRAFVDIENAHFENAIHITVDVPEEIRQYACLNITLQPFVENSIVHGIGEHPEIREMHIRVSAAFVPSETSAEDRKEGNAEEESEVDRREDIIHIEDKTDYQGPATETHGGTRQDILFTVEDDGPGISPEIARMILAQKPASAQKGYGISNINFRLKICYGELYGVSYDPSIGKGTRARIRIRALGLEELEDMLEV